MEAKRTNKTKEMVMAGLMIALAQILSYIKVYEMPYGGSVTAASMVPIIIFGLFYGLKSGLLAAFVYGVLQFILGGGISLHPLSILMDYLLAFGVLGFSGLFYSQEKSLKKAVTGSLLASVLRYVMLVLSGVIVWGAYAPEGMGVWHYSIVYNLSYMLPETILTLIVVALIYGKVYDWLQRS
ncbi:MAG: energy-coupled thiamine transporter ThiT [Tissierellia bacterium]|nr:energy-coupled thiamine transporter ThiT [Tissierellia bacterium]